MIEEPAGANYYLPLAVRTASAGVQNDLVASIGFGGAYMATFLHRRLVLHANPMLTYTSASVTEAVKRFGYGLDLGFNIHWLRPWRGNVSLFNGFDVTLERTTRAAIVPGDDRHTWQATVGGTALSYEMTSDLKSFHIGATGGRGWLGLMDRTSNEGFWFVGVGLAATMHHERLPSPLPTKE